MSYIGINIGAVAVKVVSLEGDQASFRVVNHHGQSNQVLGGVLGEFPAAQAYGVCGDLGHISEVAATQAAMAFVGGDFDALASLGGETFTIYLLKGAKILTALSHNQCAAGSGEFFLQLIARLGLSLEEGIARSFDGKAVPMASRCSVHCKSDITHKLNRREASVEDILRTIHDSMAERIVALLEKAPRPVGRLLVVGGLCQNRALMAALREKLPRTQLMVATEGPYFEALGAALLARVQPTYDRPQLAVRPVAGVAPALAPYQDQVILAPGRRSDRSGGGPFVLGVDAGSTTTKAVLMDPSTLGIVASDYRRTGSDPVEAMRGCLLSLAGQVGDRRVGLMATTGSARELTGAYLGTSNVYNEISAHAAGAGQVDPEVDTIFEIGGQDSKYILLRNRVPVNYAMNASCSAGTGSFLEECAQGDLGLSLEQIADAAMEAQSPVQFKSTCAAFINSDIRAALQEGCSQQDVAAGLVYAVVHNYLSKVKGNRPVGRRVLFQGGLAMNRAVGCAMAQCLGKQVTIPPHPELLGAVGAALLAIENTPAGVCETTDLASLAQPAMKAQGHFACEGCDNHCTIDRFAVAQRWFPFGGKCSRFESARRRSDSPAQPTDLVEMRNRLIFDSPAPSPVGPGKRGRIGIPRALTSHSLYPLYSTFFSRLGMEVVLSGVDGAGPLKAASGFCFPMQIAHGAVLNLLKTGTNVVFLPQVARMENPQGSRDSYLCPVAQASPYVIAKAFPEATILSAVLDFSHGYEPCGGMVQLAQSQLGIDGQEAKEAYRDAVRVQVQVEQAMHRLGASTVQEAIADGQPTVLLVGRSYNAYAPESSQSVARKLASMGVRVIPGDCLPQEQPGPLAWHYPNIIMNAAALAKRHANLFVLYVSNFSCTIDAFTHSVFRSELGSKPYLMLEIDAHTADAGVQTRLEAFWEVLRNYRPGQAVAPAFRPARVGGDGMVTTSAGERIALGDRRVKIYVPSFSHYHCRAVIQAGKWLGLNMAPPMELNDRQLEQGLRHSSGRECLPLPICIGQMLEAHRNRAPGEVVGFALMPGGAPCVVECYIDYFHRFVQESQLADLFIFDPEQSAGQHGVSARRVAQSVFPVLTLADLFVEMEQALRVVGQSDGPQRLRACWERYVTPQPSPKALKADLKAMIDEIARIPHADPAQRPKVVVTGDFFLRFSPSFMDGIHERYTQAGIILMPVGLNELLLYTAYSDMARLSRDRQSPGVSPWAAAAAGLRFLQSAGRQYLVSWAQYRWLKYHDDRYRRLFRPTGLLMDVSHDIGRLCRRAAGHISPTVGGESISTVGKAVAAGKEGFDGVIAIGPFNCLAFHISEAILKPYGWQTGLPILTHESDGFSVHPAFLRQVDVHIQQVIASQGAGRSRAR